MVRTGAIPVRNAPTDATIYRRIIEARIDACVNARHPKPVIPWIPMPRARLANLNGYTITRSDVWNLVCYAWKRGVNEFCPFAHVAVTAGNHPAADYDAGYQVCRDLATYVQITALNSDRTGRLARLGRRT